MQFKGYIRKNEKILAREVGFMRVLAREFKGVYDAARYNLKKMIVAFPPKTVTGAILPIHEKLKIQILKR